MRVRRNCGVVFLILWCGWPPVESAPENPPGMLGFSPGAVEEQRRLESKMDAALDPAQIGDWIRRLSSRPHHAGSPKGRENAQFMVSLFRSWGYESWLDEYRILFPTPKLRRLEMLEPTPFRARLVEPALAEDSTSNQSSEQLPAYNAYSPDGEATGQLVYVNYGIPADYEQLERRGIQVKDRIVIARYGGSWRGLKPKLAAEQGALACIIYSDPRDDGYFQGDAYPRGPFRSEDGVERGSVLDMPIHPGDPLTPFTAATEDADRLSRSEAPTLPRIPVLPISHEDALPLLSALEGPVAPPHWRGALPITYHLGPGPATVRLKLEFNWDLVPAYNVIAKLEGREEPDQWILRGNHHDAWVHGARDPVSGVAAMLAEARAVASLTEDGWRPRRSIVYAAWDAEEPGLIGSTEWAEEYADELKEKAVVYVNSDSNGRGFLSAGGSHSLETLVNQVARDVDDPQTDLSVLQRALARRTVSIDPLPLAPVERVKLGALGSGSDYTPFLQHLGVASLNLAFGGESPQGSYHSLYDSFDHYRRFMDPGYRYGVVLAQVAGRTVLRLANAEILPLEFTRLAATLEGYLKEVMDLAGEMRRGTEALNRWILRGYLKAASDPTQTYVAPAPQNAVPFVNFAPLRNAMAGLQASARKYAEAYGRFASAGMLPEAERLKLNRILMGLEQKFAHPEGLPERPWYRHHIYAPGFYTGYGVKTLPGVREAIEQRKWEHVEAQIERAAGLIRAYSGDVERAASLLASRPSR